MSQAEAETSIKPVAYSYAQSEVKLFMLLLATFGLYRFVWLYRNWMHLREAGYDVSPWRRLLVGFIPIIGLFINFGLYERLREMMYKRDPKLTFPLNTYFWGGLVLYYFFWGLPDVFCLLGILSYLPITAVQAKLNTYWALEQPDQPIRQGLSRLEMVIIGLGFLWWLRFLYLHFLMPETSI